MKWRLKSALFQALEIIPFGESIHYLMQRYITKQWPRQYSILDELIIAGQQIVESARTEICIPDSKFLEIGAGRDLAVALVLRTLGVKQVTAVDISRIARIDLINHSAAYISSKLNTNIPYFTSFRDLEDFGIFYIAPSSIFSLPDSEYSCFYSVDTLEHIPPEDLFNILDRSLEKIKDDGISIHIIDYSDHYARGSNASRFNFLYYTEDQWQAHNSKFLYTNRLRHSEFVDLFHATGHEIISEETFALPLCNVDKSRLDSRFGEMSDVDIATIHSKIVARSK